MALARLARQAKRPFGLCAKMTVVAILGLCFIVVWSIFSSPSSSLTTQRESFDDISQPVSSRSRSKPPPLLNHNSQSQVFESNKTKTIEDHGNQHQPSKHGNPKQGSNRQKHHPTSKKKLPSSEEETNGNPLMCLVPLPHQGYGSPVRWPESKLQVLYSIRNPHRALNPHSAAS
ncbi:Probable methyltransferase PMT28 [Linum perenne]